MHVTPIVLRASTDTDTFRIKLRQRRADEETPSSPRGKEREREINLRRLKECNFLIYNDYHPVPRTAAAAAAVSTHCFQFFTAMDFYVYQCL